MRDSRYTQMDTGGCVAMVIIILLVFGTLVWQQYQYSIMKEKYESSQLRGITWMQKWEQAFNECEELKNRDYILWDNVACVTAPELEPIKINLDETFRRMDDNIVRHWIFDNMPRYSFEMFEAGKYWIQIAPDEVAQAEPPDDGIVMEFPEPDNDYECKIRVEGNWIFVENN